MITCNLMGGLGNQLFQIVTTISYAMKSHNWFKFTNAKVLGKGSNVTLRTTYWDTFLARLKHFTTDQFPQMHIIREKEFAYNELPVYEMVNNNIMITGYFQSYKYFEDNFPTIYRMIGVDSLKEQLLTKLNYTPELLTNTISMHFRIGDYKPIQDCHPVLKIDYYIQSFQHIQLKYPTIDFQVMYFCEDVDAEEVTQIITQLQKRFPRYTFLRFGKELEDWEQMVFMSCCRHNIIANSSFSWWGAYLNQTEDKIVCYPSVWFGPTLSGHNTKDLCPNEWTKINL